MPRSSKGSKKGNSKEQIDSPTPPKVKVNKVSIISNLFGRGKTKNKSVPAIEETNQPETVTCLYAKSAGSLVSSNVTNSIFGDVDVKQISIEEMETIQFIPDVPNKDDLIAKRNIASQISFCVVSSDSASCCISHDIPLMAILNEVLHLNTRLQDSENRIVQMFVKYLKNESLERDLVDIVSAHAKIQTQIERRSQAIASEMWKQQSELYKNQEKILTDSLKEMIWQNRRIQEENEILMRKLDNNDIQDNPTISQGDIPIVEKLRYDNERLRNKVSGLTHQLNELENNYLNEKNKFGSLEEQFSACFSDLQAEKSNIQAIKMDRQLEVSTLRQELDAKDKTIEDALECGEVLLKEIERINQLSPSFSNKKYQAIAANPISGVIEISKNCIGTFGEKIVCLEERLKVIEAERNHFQSEALRFQRTLDVTSKEMLALTEQTNLLNSSIQEKENLLKTVVTLEKDKSVVEDELQIKENELNDMKKEKELILEGIYRVKDVIRAKEDELKYIRAENQALLFQNKSLSQILMQSGSGDVARELASSQEKLQTVQSHYYQITAQNEKLEEKLKLQTTEIEKLKTTNGALTQKLNIQSETLNELQESQLKLKEEIATQQSTLYALQNERRRHLSEKNFLRSIYDKIQMDASKTECLEGSLSEISKEADRLAIIAEYNKQIGEMYQKEIKERDEIIKQLKESLRSLNSAHETNIKEKAALCEELTEVCSIKEILTSKLEMEVKNSVHATKSAKEIESTVNNELKALKEMQKVERSAVKELLEDFNVLVNQRDVLAKYKSEAGEQLQYLKEELKNYIEDNEMRKKDLQEKEQAIVWYREQMQIADEKSKRLTERVERTLKNQIIDMEGLINENNNLRTEMETHKTSIEYLKSNVHNLQNSLDHSRENENEYRKLLESEREKFQSLCEELKISNAKHVEMAEELTIIKEKYSQANQQNQQIFKDYNELVKTLPEHEDILKRCKTMETLVQDYEHQIAKLEEALSGQSVKIQSLENDNRKQIALIEQLTHEESKLHGDLLEAVSDKEICNDKLVSVSGELEKIKLELLGKCKQLEEKTKMHQNFELIYGNLEKQLKDLTDTIQATEEKNVKLKSKFENAQKLYGTLEATHKKLAEKLLKTVHSLMNEKIARRSAETSYDEVTKKLTNADAIKEDLIQKIQTKSETIAKYQQKLIEFDNCKIQLEVKLNESSNNYKAILRRYDDLIREFAANEIKCRELEERLDKFACPKCKELKVKISELKSNLDCSEKIVIELQEIVTNLKLNITTLEFETSEKKLQLHNIEKQLEVERSLREESQEKNSELLQKALELKGNDLISKSACDVLLSVVQKSFA